MNTNRKYKSIIIMALAAILLQAFSANAQAAQAGEGNCQAVLENAQATLARIDVPATRAEYAALDRIADCVAVAGTAVTLPVTGQTASDEARFMGLNQHQAEMFVRPAYSPYRNHDFIEFKEWQSSCMPYSRSLERRPC